MYKITFHLDAPVSFIQRPVFDGILAWCWMKEKHGTVEAPLSIPAEKVETFDELPITRHPDGYFLASWIMFDEMKAIEFLGSWKKRWDNRHDQLADFGKKKRKVRINAGEFKAYDMPITLHHIREVWFYFDSPDVDAVKHLLRHLYGIGKKTSQGYARITSFKIEEINYNPFTQIIRPIPASEKDIPTLLATGGHLGQMAWKPPYWLPENHTFCYLP